MKVFLAGATGVIGRRLVPMLLDAGHEVTGMTRTASKAQALHAAGAKPVICDALDARALQQAVIDAQPEVVVHQLTALPKRIDPRTVERDFALNDRLRDEGTRNLVAAAQAAGARRLIAQSIAFTYAPAGSRARGGNPTAVLHTEDDPLFLQVPGAMRRTINAQAALEHAVTSAPAIEGVVLRYGYFYGPGTAYAPDGSVAEALRRRQYPIGGKGSGVWPFIHVDDAARATIAAIDSTATGIFNIVDDEPAPVSQWLPALADAVGAKPPRRVPLPLVRLFAGAYAAHVMSTAEGCTNQAAKRQIRWGPQHRSWREGFRAGT